MSLNTATESPARLSSKLHVAAARFGPVGPLGEVSAAKVPWKAYSSGARTSKMIPRLVSAKKVPVPTVDIAEFAVPTPDQFNVFPNWVVKVAVDAAELRDVDASAVASSGLSF
jgi:hypothetical protein